MLVLMYGSERMVWGKMKNIGFMAVMIATLEFC